MSFRLAAMSRCQLVTGFKYSTFVTTAMYQIDWR